MCFWAFLFLLLLFCFLEEADIACSPMCIVVVVVGFMEWSMTAWTSMASPPEVVAGGGGKGTSAAIVNGFSNYHV